MNHHKGHKNHLQIQKNPHMIATLEMWVLTIEVLGEEAKAIRKTSLEAGVSEDHLEVDGAEDQQDKRSRRSHLRLPR